MGATPERQVDHHSHPENIPFITKILWEGNSDFKLSPIDLILEEGAVATEHEIFGQGHSWRLGFIGGLRTKLDFYPQHRILNLTFNDSKGNTIERSQVVDSIGVGYLGSRKGVAFLSERDMKSDIVLVQPLGNFDEFHRLLVGEKQVMPIPITQEPIGDTNNISGQEPEWVSKTLVDMTYDDIDSIFRVLFPKGAKAWRKKGHDALKTKAESFMRNAIDKIETEELNEDESQIFRYIKLRFIDGLDMNAVADVLGYSREHTTRKFRAVSIRFLLEKLE